jgi:hypothetical protein
MYYFSNEFILILKKLTKYNLNIQIKLNLIYHCLIMFLKIMFSFIYVNLTMFSLNHYFKYKIY